jgi:hypothetical protein
MTSERPLARSLEDLRPLHQLCRDGRLYEVERWIAEGQPLQLAPEAIHKSARPKTALEIALDTGQHSLVSALLKSKYRLALERYRPLDLALQKRRWDLFDLLLEAGGDLKSVDVYTVLNTYNVELYERFRAAGYDLTDRHEMGSILGHGTSNRPLLGFLKRHRAEDPRLQTELNIALGYHARAGNERGVALCLWAGADPHAPAPDPDFRVTVSPSSGEDDDAFVGWSAVEEAATAGHLKILKRLGPDPARDDIDHLYQFAKSESIIAHLATIQLPKDLTSALSWHLRWMVHPFPLSTSRGSGTVEKLLTCGVRWEETDPKKLAQVRGSLVKAREYELRSIFRHLKRPEICAPETVQELIRHPKMRERLLALGLLKKPPSRQERRHAQVRGGPASRVGPSLDQPVGTDPRLPRIDELPGEWAPAAEALGVATPSRCYDRKALYDQVWSQPVQVVARSYGVSGVALAKTCRKLQIPVPPRGYWARIRSGQKVRRPPLPGQ